MITAKKGLIMPDKIKRFEDVIGNKNTINFLLDHLKRDTMPSRIIFEGEEGLGKTTLAKLVAMGLNCSGDTKPCYKCASCRSIMEDVIENNRNTDSVQVYNMSVDSGKDAAKQVKANLSPQMSNTGKRVIICDEAHGMSDAAQDVFLVDMEYLPKGTYLFFCTTDAHNLKKTLKSRSFSITLHRPARKELIGLLAKTAVKNNLTIQGGNATLQLIADWAENKPRKALNLLEGFGTNNAVSAATVKEFINYVNIDMVLPILDSLGGSLVSGLTYSQEVPLNDTLINVLTDVLAIKLGAPCYKFSTDDLITVRGYLEKIKPDTLITFIKALTRTTPITRSSFVSALLEAHPQSNKLYTRDVSVLQDELEQKSEIPKTIVNANRGVQRKAPQLDALLRSANKIGD